MDVAAELNAAGIRLRDYRMGNHYTTCPKCSHLRKKEHQKSKCLSVKIDDKGSCFICHNCGYKDARNAESSTPSRPREQGHRRRVSDPYGDLYRQAMRQR